MVSSSTSGQQQKQPAEDSSCDHSSSASQNSLISDSNVQRLCSSSPNNVLPRNQWNDIDIIDSIINNNDDDDDENDDCVQSNSLIGKKSIAGKSNHHHHHHQNKEEETSIHQSNIVNQNDVSEQQNWLSSTTTSSSQKKTAAAATTNGKTCDNTQNIVEDCCGTVLNNNNNIDQSTAPTLFNNNNKTSHLEPIKQQQQLTKLQQNFGSKIIHDKNNENQQPSSSSSSPPPPPTTTTISSSNTTTTTISSASSSIIKTDSSSSTFHHRIPPLDQNHNPTISEVELISVVNQSSGPIPQYKLRVDSATKFTGYPNNDWLIETPLIDLEAPIDLNPILLRETFKLFIQSGQRLTQMTKVYDDVEALTKLLEEKERDVELAARIGSTLLDENQHQSERIDELEQELLLAKDRITQLRHEVSSKSDLLKFYIKKDEEDFEEEDNNGGDGANDDELNLTSVSSLPSFSKDASLILDELDRRVHQLEEENNRLKNEKESNINNLEAEERKELQLINECARRLSQTNRQIASLQEELAKKTDENHRLEKELNQLKQQVNNLEKQIRKLTVEKEELVGALDIAHECQSELTIELIDVKEKHSNLLGAFHEKQEECRQLREQQFNDHIFSYVDSLAYELDNSFHSCQFDDNTTSGDGHLNHHHHHHHQNGKNGNLCHTPDSLLSSDSFYTSSPYSSIVVTSSLQPPVENLADKSSSSSSSPQPASSTAATKQQNISINEHNFPSSSSPLPPPPTETATKASKIGTTISNLAKHHHRNYFLTDKLRYIKPLEGSQILNHWRRLANPNLNDLFEDKDRYVSRIKANLVAAEVCSRFADSHQPQKSLLDQKTTDGNGVSDGKSTESLYANNFVTTNSVFTFTTTSLSHTKETMTEVTTTFSDVRPSTGQDECSVYNNNNNPSAMKKRPSSSSSSNLFQNPASFAQMHNRISLVEQVKNIIKVDQLLPPQPPPPSAMMFHKSRIKKTDPSKNGGDGAPTNSDKITNDKCVDDKNDQNDDDGRVSTGLNELAKLLSLDVNNSKTLDRRKPPSSSSSSLSTKVFMTNGMASGGGGGGGSRMITKIQMANNPIKKANISSKDKTTDDGGGGGLQSSSSSSSSPTTGASTNLSVLRNLRKGGLI